MAEAETPTNGCALLRLRNKKLDIVGIVSYIFPAFGATALFPTFPLNALLCQRPERVTDPMCLDTLIRS